MTRAETAKIQLMLLSALRLTRPIPDEELLLDAWELALGDLDVDACQRAAAVLLREERYFPEPSAIRDLVLKEQTGLPDTDEAWRLVCDMIHRHHATASLLAQKALAEAIRGLGGLYNLRRSERPDRDRADFYKAWPEIRRRYLREAMGGADALVNGERAILVNGTYYAVDRGKKQDRGEPIEDDRGMGLVDYETQAPKPVPRTIVPKQGAW